MIPKLNAVSGFRTTELYNTILPLGLVKTTHQGQPNVVGRPYYTFANSSKAVSTVSLCLHLTCI